MVFYWWALTPERVGTGAPQSFVRHTTPVVCRCLDAPAIPESTVRRRAERCFFLSLSACALESWIPPIGSANTGHHTPPVHGVRKNKWHTRHYPAPSYICANQSRLSQGGKWPGAGGQCAISFVIWCGVCLSSVKRKVHSKEVLHRIQNLLSLRFHTAFHL